MSRTKKLVASKKPAVLGNAADIIGLFQGDSFRIEINDRGRITITRLGRTIIDVYVEVDGEIVINGHSPLSIEPAASNMIRIP